MRQEITNTIIELKIRNYSPKTIKSYTSALRRYFAYKRTNLNTLDQQNIRRYLCKCQENAVSPHTRNIILSAIKFYYRNITQTPTKIRIPTAKKPKKLPIVLSRHEIQRLIKTTKNSKHKLILALTYGGGLRVSEAVSLKVQDCDLNELTFTSNRPKGKKTASQ